MIPVLSRSVLFLGRVNGQITAMTLPLKAAGKPRTMEETMLFRRNIVGRNPTLTITAVPAGGFLIIIGVAITHVTRWVVGIFLIPNM